MTVTPRRGVLAKLAPEAEGPARPAEAGAPHATMDQRHETFVPPVLAVPAPGHGRLRERGCHAPRLIRSIGLQVALSQDRFGRREIGQLADLPHDADALPT